MGVVRVSTEISSDIILSRALLDGFLRLVPTMSTISPNIRPVSLTSPILRYISQVYVQSYLPKLSTTYEQAP